MVQTGFDFNPKRDIQEVDQFGFVDAHHSLLSGTVPSDLKVDATRFNEMDVDQVGHYIRDNFEAMDAGRDLNRRIAAGVTSEASEEGNAS